MATVCISSQIWRGVSPQSLWDSGLKSGSEKAINKEKDSTQVPNPPKKKTQKRSKSVAGEGGNRKKKPVTNAASKAASHASPKDLPIRPSKAPSSAMSDVLASSSKANVKMTGRGAQGEREDDPYSLPLSPTSAYRHKENNSSIRKNLASEAKSKFSSPVANQSMIYGVQKKRGNAKRVPKRSILDPVETPAPKNDVVPSAHDSRPHTTKPSLESTNFSATLPKTDLPVNSPQVAAKTRNLRPRRSRVPILISSDSENNSWEQDGSEGDFFPESPPPTTISRKPVIRKAPRQTPSPRDRASEEHDEVDLLRHVEHGEDVTEADEQPEAVMTEYERAWPASSKVKTPGELDLRKNRKRQVPLVQAAQHEFKRPRKEPAQEPARVVKAPVDLYRKSTQDHGTRDVLFPMPASDPFSGDANTIVLEPSKFTTRLLRTNYHGESLGPTAKDITENAQPQRARPPTKPVMPTAEHRRGVGKSHDIARKMMQVFEQASVQKCSAENSCNSREQKDVWLDDTNPYTETGHIMSYVCKTILRFLKSKEAAIDDVADEYRQRGENVIRSIRALHAGERVSMEQKFEGCRLGSLRVFEAAYNGVHMLATRLGEIDVAPLMGDVLADDTVSRLRALQALA